LNLSIRAKAPFGSLSEAVCPATPSATDLDRADFAEWPINHIILQILKLEWAQTGQIGRSPQTKPESASAKFSGI
jgi:hypothetical protein